MEIREYRNEDCRTILDLMKETIRTVNAEDYSQEEINAWIEGITDEDSFHERLAEGFALIAEEDQTILGFGNIKEEGTIDCLYVAHDHIRNGIGTALVKALEETRFCPQYEVHSSLTARPFFEAMGYEVTDKEEVCRRGISIRRYMMKKDKTEVNNLDRLTQYAMKIRAIAQEGLTYGYDPFDLNRSRQLKELSEQMLAEHAGMDLNTVSNLFAEEGYTTPKVDTRAAVFKDGKILMVHEKNGTWALPGGWCDVDESVGSNAIKETEEEAGILAEAVRLIAVHDWRRHNRCNLPYGVMKCFVQCSVKGGEFHENIETRGIGFFGKDELPKNIAEEKDTRDQILMCFKAYESENWTTEFD